MTPFGFTRLDYFAATSDLNFHDLTFVRDLVVGWDRTIAGGHEGVPGMETKSHAAFVVVAGADLAGKWEPEPR